MSETVFASLVQLSCRDIVVSILTAFFFMIGWAVWNFIGNKRQKQTRIQLHQSEESSPSGSPKIFPKSILRSGQLLRQRKIQEDSQIQKVPSLPEILKHEPDTDFSHNGSFSSENTSLILNQYSKNVNSGSSLQTKNSRIPALKLPVLTRQSSFDAFVPASLSANWVLPPDLSIDETEMKPKLTWKKQPRNVFLVKKWKDAEITKSLKIVADWLIQEQSLKIFVEDHTHCEFPQFERLSKGLKQKI